MKTQIVDMEIDRLF